MYATDLIVTNRSRMCSVDLNVNKMSDAKEIQGRPAGRPVLLTNSAKKRKKSESNARFNKSKVYIGNQFDRWIAVKEDWSRFHLLYKFRPCIVNLQNVYFM